MIIYFFTSKWTDQHHVHQYQHLSLAFEIETMKIFEKKTMFTILLQVVMLGCQQIKPSHES